MARYEVTKEFKELGFEYQPSVRGSLEMYVYDETQDSPFDDRTFRFRTTIVMDIDTGMPCSVGVNFFSGKDCVFYESEDEPIKCFTGLYCERHCLDFIQKKLYAFNTLLGTHFEVKGLPARDHGLWN